jgi:hypothetical protein
MLIEARRIAGISGGVSKQMKTAFRHCPLRIKLYLSDPFELGKF